MNRVLTWFAVIAMAIGLWFAAGQLSFAEEDACTVTELKGTVMVTRAGSVKEFKAFLNMRLNEGDAVRTGPSSHVTVKVDSDQIFKVAANSEVVVSELKNKADQTNLTLNIRKGGVGSYINKKLKEKSDYRIKTPTAVMGVRGTEFFVQYEAGKTEVWLTKGILTIDYRRHGNTALPLTSTEGVHEQIVLNAPAKAILDATHGAPGDVVKAYSSDGLYEEFLQDLMDDFDDYEDFLEDLEELKEKHKKSLEIRHEKEMEDEQDDDDDREVIEYDEPSVSDDDEDSSGTGDESNDDDDDDDDFGAVPPKPVGNYAYVRKVSLHGVVQRVEQWVPYYDLPVTDQIVLVVLGYQVPYLDSELEANNFIIDMLMIP